LPKLGIHKDGPNCITTVFHPDYTYGDFIGKLLPLTVGDKVTYEFYPGFFLRSLASAYKNLISIDVADLGRVQNKSMNSDDYELMLIDDIEVEYLEPPLSRDDEDPFSYFPDYQEKIPSWMNEPPASQNVALVIDEINRGNSSAIFGSVFQLLDRDADGWSTTSVNLSNMEYSRLVLDVFGKVSKLESLVRGTSLSFLMEKKIKLPPNLSILATMNTSDESIFFMDSAFKRRWEWQFVEIDGGTSEFQSGVEVFTNERNWRKFVVNVNKFIRENHLLIRGIEDKQIGYWFIPHIPITKGQIQNKLMFYLWDSVFRRDKEPLQAIVSEPLITFGDFARQIDKFLLHFDVKTP
jgi:5-methylcytosine-specific restriction protein B